MCCLMDVRCVSSLWAEAVHLVHLLLVLPAVDKARVKVEANLEVVSREVDENLVVSVPVVCSSVAHSDAVVQVDVDGVAEVEVVEGVEAKALHYPRTNWTHSWTTTTRKTGWMSSKRINLPRGPFD